MPSMCQNTRPFLLRRPAHENARIIICRCLLCGYLVGASSFEISLHIAEMAHSCQELLQRGG